MEAGNWNRSAAVIPSIGLKIVPRARCRKSNITGEMKQSEDRENGRTELGSHLNPLFNPPSALGNKRDLVKIG